jgi:hypothetical protein
MFALPDGFEKGQDAGRRNAFGFGRAAREFARAGRRPGGPAPRDERQQAYARRPDTNLPEKRSTIQSHALRIPSSRSERQA